MSRRDEHTPAGLAEPLATKNPPSVGPNVRATLSRRELGRAAVGISLALSLPAAACSAATEGTDDGDLFDFFFIDGRDAAARIGKAYLDEYGEPVIFGQIPLLAEPAERIIVSATTRELVADMLDRAIAEDFEAGDVVVVEGWVLARHEAALCALAFAHSRRS